MYKLIVLFTLIFISSKGFTQTKEITLRDRLTNHVVSNAHILNTDGEVLTISNQEGIFMLPNSDTVEIQIKALGYQSKILLSTELGHIIYLYPIVLELDQEIVIIGNTDKSNNTQAYEQESIHKNMDHFMNSIDGVSMIQRGAFAWEPSVRGESDQRMNLTIDGMSVFKACVDKMDPITSYVEINNLSSLKIDKTGASVAENGSGNATINLITQKASQAPFKIILETTHQSPGKYQAYRFGLSGSNSKKNNAFRLSGSFKKSGDIYAANSQRVENTQYQKLNVNLYYEHTFKTKHSLEVNYITDKAKDVGYPSLLMDATEALADIGRVQFNFAKSERKITINKFMVYANSIRHSMDDYERDVTNRSVMRGMYMPMFGTTKTFGSKLDGKISLGLYPLNWFVDVFASEANGDMEMQSLDETIEDMIIFNMDEVHTKSISFGLRRNMQISRDFLLKVEGSSRYQSIYTTSKNHASFFEGLYNKQLDNRNKLLFSASGSLLWMVNNGWSITNTLVYSERMGNHMELYGHYVYNYIDGFFYDGNPWLNKEQSLTLDINSTWKSDNYSISITTFGKRYSNYIDGLISTDLSNNDFQFKQYANVGNVYMLGAEARAIQNLQNKVRFDHRLSYLLAKNIELNDPLPLIPPLSGQSSISYKIEQSRIGMKVEWAADQNRISTTYIEDKTTGYVVLGFNLEKSWLEESISGILEINNITDRYYHQHTSIGNIPQQGFNVMLTLKYRLGGE